jgi:peptidyl-tRNA hydrolase, PTH1 family
VLKAKRLKAKSQKVNWIIVWCIVGLGNPGDQYQSTRHNIGFDLIDLLSTRWRIPVDQSGSNYVFGSGNRRNNPVLLVKPMTFMNRSGDAVKRILRDPEVNPKKTLIVLDDFYLPLGKMRLRYKGGDGGHNGLGSIIEVIGSEDVPRLRVGIGEADANWMDYVLEPFSAKERIIIDDTLDNAVKAVDSILSVGVEKSMNRWNC